MRCHVGASVRALVGALVLCATARGPAPGGEVGASGPSRALESLREIRDGLRDRLRARVRADAAVEQPRDFVVTFDSGVEGRPMDLFLHRRGGRWLSPRAERLSDKVSADPAVVGEPDVSGLVLDGDRLSGKVVVAWVPGKLGWHGRRPPPRPAFAEASSGQALRSLGEGGRPVRRTQTFEIDARTRPGLQSGTGRPPGRGGAGRERPGTGRLLVATLHRAMQKRDVTLVYGRAGGEGDERWRLADYRLPARSKYGEYRLAASDLRRGEAGGLEGTVEITRQPARQPSRQGGDLPRPGGPGRGARPSEKELKHIEQFNARKPVFRFRGEVSGGRFEGSYTATGVFGRFRDRASGVVVTSSVEGRYDARGDAGEWRGDVTGIAVEAPRDPVALHETSGGGPGAPDGHAAMLAEASGLYREICALDLALRAYPMGLGEALERANVPEAAPSAGEGDADGAGAAGAYGECILAFARQAREGPDARPAAAATVPPDFGPYFPSIALESPPGTPNVFPATTGEAGEQEWRHPTGWRFAGPFPAFEQDGAPYLPEIVPVPGVGYRRTRLLPDDAEDEAEERADCAGWLELEGDGPTVRPPDTPEAWSGKMRSFAWYASTDIHSERDRTVWLGVRASDRGRLWINDALAWASPPGHDGVKTAVFEARLRKGANRVLFRCASRIAGAVEHLEHIEWYEGWKTPHPRGAVEHTSLSLHVSTGAGPGEREAVGGARREAVPSVALGFRGDGAARYPGAEPPLVWDARPGEKGANVLWRRELPPSTADMVLLAAEGGGRLLVTAEPDALFCLDAGTGQVLWKREAGGAEPRAEARFLASAAPVARPAPEARVWVCYGTGVAACYDLGGEPVWRVRVAPGSSREATRRGRTGAGWSDPSMGSPVLAGDILVLQTPAEGAKDEYALVALDAGTGKLLWRRTRPGGFGPGIAAVRLLSHSQGAGAEFHVLVTAAGQVLLARTGETVHEDISGIEVNRAAPYVHEGVAYFTPFMGISATELWLEGRGNVGARPLWRIRRVAGRGQAKSASAFGAKHWYEGPVLHDGLLYVQRTDTAHVPQHYPCPWSQLDAYDAATGRNVAQIRALMRGATDPTVPPAFAGGYVFVGNGGDPVGGFGGETGGGKMAVVVPGSPPFAAAVNRTGKMRASPVFDGPRMYLRAYDSVACIEVTTKEGRRVQEETLARFQIEAIGQRPKSPKVTEVAPDARFVPSGQAPVTRLTAKQMPTEWLSLGPLPSGKGVGALGALGGEAAARPTRGAEVASAGTALRFEALDGSFIVGTPGEEALDILGAVKGSTGGPGGGKTRSVSYYYTVLDCVRAGVVQFQAKGRGITAWLSGVKIRHEEIVRLRPGYYPLLVRVELSRLPPFVRSFAIRPRFRAVEDPGKAYASWVGAIRLRKARLERAARELPGTDEARKARWLLSRLDGPGESRSATPREAERARPGGEGPSEKPKAANAVSPAPAGAAGTDVGDGDAVGEGTTPGFIVAGAVAAWVAVCLLGAFLIVRKLRSARA